MTSEPALDPRVRGIDTTDAELAHEIIRRGYRVITMTRGGAEPFHFSRHVNGDERFSLSRLRYSDEMNVLSGPLPFFCVTRLNAGTLALSSGDVSIVVRPGQHVVLPTDQNLTTRAVGIEVVQTLLDRTAVERELVSRGVETPPEGLHFTLSTARTPDLARLWSAVAEHVHRDIIGNEEAMASELIRGATFRLLVSTLVEAFASNAERPERSERAERLDDDATGSDGRSLPATVRRALDYIDEHAHDDIGLGEIALAARLTPRGLQFAFRRHLDTTPMAALRLARLRGAHEDLLVADPSRGHTVAGIAMSWGFVHAGRFTAAYVEEYGHSPRHTLDS